MEELNAATVHLAAKGDRKAFRQFYDHYAPYVWRLVYRTAGGDRECAAQVTQDVFVRAYKALRRFDSRSAVSTWLYRIAYNATMSAMARRRQEKKRDEAMVEGTGCHTVPDITEAREVVEKILAELDPDDRFLLVSREVDNVPFEELAAITGVNAGALRTRLSRLKQTIRERSGYEDQR